MKSTLFMPSSKVLVMNLYLNFPSRIQTGCYQLPTQRSLIENLFKSWAQDLVNLYGIRIYLRSQLRQRMGRDCFPQSVILRLHTLFRAFAVQDVPLSTGSLPITRSAGVTSTRCLPNQPRAPARSIATAINSVT